MSTTSPAVLTGADGSSRLQSVEVPRPGSGELVLELEGCGLCGTDLVKIASRRRAPSGDPVVLGHEVVGRVVEAGLRAPFEPGARLAVAHHVPCGRCRLCAVGAETSCEAYLENQIAPGGFSERLLVRARGAAHSAFPLDDGLPLEDAVFLEPAACVLRGVERADLPEGSRVGILGAGSMGLLHLLVLRCVAPDAVIHLAEPDARRRARADALGADATGEALPEQGYDVVFDTVGGGEALAAATTALRPAGTVILFAHGRPDQFRRLDPHRVFRGEIRIAATYSSGRRDQVRSFELLSGGALQPGVIVSHRLPLSSFDDACRLADSAEALKVVLTPDDRLADAS